MSGSSAPIVNSDFFLVRVPAYSFKAIETLRDEFARGTPLVQSGLVHDPFVCEAVFLASESLYDAIYDGAGRGGGRRTDLALAKYLYRLCSRPTPFGLFASVGMGVFGESLALAVPGINDVRRYCRLDHTVIAELAAEFQKKVSQFACAPVAVRKNGTLWLAPDGLRYVQTVLDDGKTRYLVSRIDGGEAIATALRLAESPEGIILDRLLERLTEEFAADPAEVREFVRTLLQEQLLIPVEQVKTTGEDIVDDFASALKAINGAETIASTLENVQREIADIGNDSAANMAVYRQIKRDLGRQNIQTGNGKIVHVDLQCPDVHFEIPSPILDKIIQQLWAARALFAYEPNSSLKKFAEDFTARFGDAAIPLLEAADTDFGIMEASTSHENVPLLRQMPLLAGEMRTEISSAQKWFLRKSADALLTKESTIELTDKDFEALGNRQSRFPSSFAIIASIELGKAYPADANDWRATLTVTPGPATALLGRFCKGNAKLTHKVKDFTKELQRHSPDIIYAEVVHLPEGRQGNVVERPVLAEYEIPYLGSSGALTERQIPPSDLLLHVMDEQIVLFSKRLMKRVIPRISSAHNVMQTALPAYRLLHMLQFQGEPSMQPVWSGLDDLLPYFPAIRYKNLVFSRAKLRLDRDTAKRVAKCTPEASEDLMMQLRGHAEGRVRVYRNDNFLELDLRHKLDRALLIEECRRYDVLNLEILESGERHSGTLDNHEVVIPCRSSETAIKPVAPSKEITTAYPPGSEWLYVRLFGGASALDQFVADKFPQIVSRSQAKGCTDHFFTRYNEGGLHIRLRMRVPQDALVSVRSDMEAEFNALVESHTFSRCEYATYHPEISRYGGADSIGSCEHIFSADSLATASVLAKILPHADRETTRWKFALVSMFRLLKLFALENEAAIGIVQAFAEGYVREFNYGSKNIALNNKYREHRETVDRVANGKSVLPDELDEILDERDNASVHAAAVIVANTEAGVLPGVIQSLLHMTANRIFVEQARMQELVIAHCLAKSMKSLRGRQRFAARQTAVTLSSSI